MVGPPSRISGSTRIAYMQAVSLANRGHQLKLIFQKRGLNRMEKVFTGLNTTEGVEVVALPSLRGLTPIADRLTLSYRKLRAGTHLPVTQGVWYQDPAQIRLARNAVKGNGAITEVDVDLAAMLGASMYLGRELQEWGTTTVLFYATLFALPVLPLFLNRATKTVLYLLDMPIAKTLITEGRSADSRLLRLVTRFEKWVLEHTDSVACMNHLVQRDWYETYGIRPRFIPPGCLPMDTPPGEKSDYVLTVTHWYPDKRPFYFVELARRLVQSRLKVVMAGHWPNPRDLSEMKSRIKKEGLEDKLILFPDCPEDLLVALYKEARCFLAPPKSGGYMLGALESAAVGTPIVCPKNTGAWDIFSPGIHGFAPNVEDIDDVLSCIQKFEDDKIVLKMGSSIWSRARELSWGSHCAAIEALIS